MLLLSTEDHIGRAADVCADTPAEVFTLRRDPPSVAAAAFPALLPLLLRPLLLLFGGCCLRLSDHDVCRRGIQRPTPAV